MTDNERAANGRFPMTPADTKRLAEIRERWEATPDGQWAWAGQFTGASLCAIHTNEFCIIAKDIRPNSKSLAVAIVNSRDDVLHLLSLIEAMQRCEAVKKLVEAAERVKDAGGPCSCGSGYPEYVCIRCAILAALAPFTPDTEENIDEAEGETQ